MMSYCEMLLLKSNQCLKRNDLRCNNHSDISLETRDQVSKLGAFVGYSNENSVQLCLNNTFFFQDILLRVDTHFSFIIFLIIWVLCNLPVPLTIFISFIIWRNLELISLVPQSVFQEAVLHAFKTSCNISMLQK